MIAATALPCCHVVWLYMAQTVVRGPPAEIVPLRVCLSQRVYGKVSEGGIGGRVDEHRYIDRWIDRYLLVMRYNAAAASGSDCASHCYCLTVTQHIHRDAASRPMQHAGVAASQRRQGEGNQRRAGDPVWCRYNPCRSNCGTLRMPQQERTTSA